MMVMTQISLPTLNGHAVKKVDNDMGSGDNNNNVHHHHDPEEVGPHSLFGIRASRCVM